MTQAYNNYVTITARKEGITYITATPPENSNKLSTKCKIIVCSHNFIDGGLLNGVTTVWNSEGKTAKLFKESHLDMSYVVIGDMVLFDIIARIDIANNIWRYVKYIKNERNNEDVY